MHTQRLLLHELDHLHLTYLQKAVEWSIDTEMATWLRDVRDGTLALYSLDGKGIIGLRKMGDVTFVELIAGENLKPMAQEIFTWLLSFGRSVEICTRRMGLVRFFSRFGFVPTAVWMRLEHGRE